MLKQLPIFEVDLPSFKGATDDHYYLCGTHILTQNMTSPSCSASPAAQAYRWGYSHRRLLFMIVCLTFVALSSSSSGGPRNSKAPKPARTKGANLAISRLTAELRELKLLGLTLDTPYNLTNKSECSIRLSPLTGNLREWHFSLLGPDNTPYQGGCYHGKISLPSEYPHRAPAMCMLTPSGRWEVGKDICLSVTSYHQETWNPNWSLRTLVMGLRLHMPSHAQEIGGVSGSYVDRVKLADLSRSATCAACQCSHSRLLGVLQGGARLAPTTRPPSSMDKATVVEERFAGSSIKWAFPKSAFTSRLKIFASSKKRVRKSKRKK
jgi:ubiquitin-protein ligase